MHLLIHQKIAKMLIIKGNIDKLTKHLWETSKSIPSDAIRHFYLIPMDVCDLDPGGLYFMKIPRIEFEIEDIKFSIQISKAGEMLSLFENAEERIPGYTRFVSFNNFVIVPTPIFDKIKIKLKEIELESSSLHAELYELETRENIINEYYKNIDLEKNN